MSVIKSGAGTKELTIDPTSKAMRGGLRDTIALPVCPKDTYRAGTAGTVQVSTQTNAFVYLHGAPRRITRVLRIWIVPINASAAFLNTISVTKRFANFPSFYTATTMIPTKLDSLSRDPGAVLNVVISPATQGILIGTLESKAILANTAATATPQTEAIYDFRDLSFGQERMATLYNPNQAICVANTVASSNSTNTLITYEWTEEDY